MIKFKEDFVNLMLESGAFRLGDFTLKSGRKSPFFINTGAFDNGRELRFLAEAYAKAIKNFFQNEKFDVIFGPAYKGITLAASTAVAIDGLYADVVRYSSNRKEFKDHGDVGSVIGSELRDGDRVLIIDDVMTTGSSIFEAVKFLDSQAKVKIIGAVVAIDRGERGLTSSQPAIREVSEQCGFPIISIVTMLEATRHLFDVGALDEAQLMRIDHYYDQFGPRS